MKFRFIKNNWFITKQWSSSFGHTDAASKLYLPSCRFYNEGPAAGAKAPETAAVKSKFPALTDSLGRQHNYLRISLTERCNLRCQYCMPAEGVPLSRRSALLTRSELAQAVRALADAGVDKLRLTGGEPTLRPDLADIIQELSAIEGIRSVSMTSNGLVLTRRLPALVRAGLAALNVSLDSLRADRYERMARRPGLARVLAGVDLALQLEVPVKINTVLMKGFNDDEICDFVEFTKDRKVEVRFIEFMPFSGNKWEDGRLVPHRAALSAVTARHPGLEPQRTRPNDTATVWRVPGYAGSVGFISSMTQQFCATCNRLRLTADGNLKVCLFGAAEVSLRDAVRGGADADQLRALVRRALHRKKPSHAGEWRYGEAREHGEPAHDPHRRLTHLLAPAPPARLARRAYGTRARGEGQGEGGESDWESDSESESESGPFSHLDAHGAARMVDVGDKPVTRRRAVAEVRLQASARLVRLLRDARLPKGDAVCVARVAGALACKRAADLLPLCHPLPLEMARVRVRLPRGDGAGAVRLRCEVRVTARTGAEMEALTGAAVAALALYDMCKSVDKDMRITDLRLVSKEGGRSGPYPPPPPPPASGPAPRSAPATSASEGGETFAPTNLMNF